MSKALSRPGFPPPAALSRTRLPYRIGCVALLCVAVVAGLLAPGRHGPAALALVVALGLEVASRRVARAASHRCGTDVTIRGQPSLILTLTGAPLVPAAGLAGLMALDAGGFALAASLVAGLTTMAALARLALVRAVLVHGGPGEADRFTAR